MHIGLLTIRFYLEGCTSLKEKRQRLSGIRERFGKQIHIALCESGLHDEHKHSEWSFVVVSVDDAGVSKTITLIETGLEEVVDALLVSVHRENL